MTTSLPRILRSIGAPRVLVAGDLILDQYVLGSVERVSPEAPIQVLAVRDEQYRLGGAANVANNLVKLGARVRCGGVVGADADGRRLLAELKGSGVDVSAVVRDRSRPTPLKTRMIAHHQHMLRVDRERTHPLASTVETQLARRLRKAAHGVDLVLLSDYAKGTLTERVLSVFRGGRVPVIVDPKGRDYRRYRGATAITPNEGEASLATGIPIRDEETLRHAARRLLEELSLRFILITRGERGMYLLEWNGTEVMVPSEAREVYDVTGAGDTVLAALGLVLAGGGSPEAAARLANTAGGLKVEKLGTATLTREEILARLAEHHRETEGKVYAAKALSHILEGHRTRGESVVFTNGCFDLLHPGHVRSIRFARAQGDVVVVAINSDASVRRLKGPGRPLLPAAERAEMLAALEDVDYVTVFDDPTPLRLLRLFKPDVLVKGDAYGADGVVGREVVEKQGGRVALAPMVQGVSTSTLLQRIRGE